MGTGLKLKAFTTKSRKRHECPFSSILLNMVLECLAMVVKQGKEVREV
jgi:hypothetical protein